MKKMLAAAALLAGLAFVSAAPSEAKTSVRIYLGLPHYTYRVGPDYVYRPGWGWYRPARPMYRIGCPAGRDILMRRGFRAIDTIECRGPIYTYRASRGGMRYNVHVDARNGAVFR